MVGSEEFQEWSMRYCGAFTLNIEKHGAMLSVWREVFDAGMFVIEDLNKALVKLAESPPKFRGDHLKRLNDLLREGTTVKRQAVLTDSEIKEQKFGSCTLCHGSGYVAVPHPKFLSGGHGLEPARVVGAPVVKYELGVYCRCGLGDWFYRSHAKSRDNQRDKRRHGVTLSDYEILNPEWPQQMRLSLEYEDKLRSAINTCPIPEGTSAAEAFKMIAARIVHDAPRENLYEQPESLWQTDPGRGDMEEDE